jgi:hypothetical protein
VPVIRRERERERERERGRGGESKRVEGKGSGVLNEVPFPKSVRCSLGRLAMVNTSGGDLHRTAGPGLLRVVGGGQRASSAAALPSPQRGASAQHEACVRQGREGATHLVLCALGQLPL